MGRITGTVNFYFHQDAIAIPLGETITIHTSQDTNSEGVTGRLVEVVRSSMADQHVTLDLGAPLGRVKFHVEPITAIDWKGTRHQDRGLRGLTREERDDFESAHAQGLHDDGPREGCPECDRHRNRTG